MTKILEDEISFISRCTYCDSQMYEFVVCVSLLTRIDSISQVSKKSVCTAIFIYIQQAKIDYGPV